MDKKQKLIEYEESVQRARDGEMLPVCACVRLTRLCNLSCDYCSEIRDLGKDMNFGEWKKAIDIIYDLGNRDLTITGGEPFIKEFLLDLVYHASKKGMYVSIATNGTLLTPEILNRLDQVGLDFLSLSIDRINPDGKSFGKDLNGKLEANLDYIASSEFNFTTIVSTVVTNKNYQNLEEMATYFSEREINHKLMLMMPNYENANKTDALTIKDIAGFQHVLSNLKSMKKQGYKIIDSEQILDNMAAYVEGKFSFNCFGGVYELSLNNDGRVVLCPDGTISNVHIFKMASLKNYKEFLDSHKFYSLKCDGCFWTCKQRLHDKIMHNTQYMV